MDCLSVLYPSRLLISSLFIIFLSLFYLTIFHQNSCFLFLSLFSLFHSNMVIREASIASTPLYPPSQYQPKHYHDCKFKIKKMDPAEFTQFLKHLTPLGIQWVVEWWRITRDGQSCLQRQLCSFDWASPSFLLLSKPHCKAIW